jgi:hypothetical protein
VLKSLRYGKGWAMAGKIAKIEELLGDVITEVILYRTPSGSLFETKEEAISSLIALACPHGDSKECKEYRARGLRCQDCKIGNFLRSN